MPYLIVYPEAGVSGAACHAVNLAASGMLG